MTNAKVYQGFNDDKKVEEHCSRVTFNKLYSKSYFCHKLYANLLSANKVPASCVKYRAPF